MAAAAIAATAARAAAEISNAKVDFQAAGLLEKVRPLCFLFPTRRLPALLLMPKGLEPRTLGR